MHRNLPLKQVVATGEVQGGRQRSPHMKEGRSVPYLRVANVFDGYIDFADLNRMPFKPKEIENYRLKRGDILLNEGQSVELVGRCAMYVGGPDDCCFQNTLIRYRSGPATDPEYALQLFRYCQAIGVFSRIAVKTNSIAHLGVTRFAELELPFPALEEQRKIAAILRPWDEAIENRLRLSELRKKQYLGLRDYLVDWSKHQHAAKDFLKPVSRQVSKPTSGYRALSIRSHGKGTFDRYVENPESIEMDTLYVVKSGDIIVNITFAWEGAVALVPRDHDGCLVSHRFPTFVPRMERVDARYLRHALRMARFTYLLGIVSPGGAGRNRVLSKSDFLELMVPLPPLDQQQRIAMILDDAENAISAEEKYLSALKRQKRGLMQKLLTGEWRAN
jgi:type I restriction enzyme, S subunit